LVNALCIPGMKKIGDFRLYLAETEDLNKWNACELKKTQPLHKPSYKKDLM